MGQAMQQEWMHNNVVYGIWLFPAAIQVAVKQMHVAGRQGDWESLLREVTILARASERCHRVCRLYGVTCKDDTTLYIVMKRYESSLAARMDSFPGRSLKMALACMHDRTCQSCVIER